MYENDPLWRLRHALLGVGLAVLLAVPIAALVGATVGGWIGGTYAWRAGLYTALLVYVMTGAVVLFVKLARHETEPISAERILKWLASLWLWPALLAFARKRAPNADPGQGPSSNP
jgi:MFS family permease